MCRRMTQLMAVIAAAGGELAAAESALRAFAAGDAAAAERLVEAFFAGQEASQGKAVGQGRNRTVSDGEAPVGFLFIHYLLTIV